jgi:hypothetical protein
MSTSDPEPSAPASLPAVAELPDVADLADEDIDPFVDAASHAEPEGDEPHKGHEPDEGHQADEDIGSDGEVDVSDGEVPDAAEYYGHDEVYPWETDEEPTAPRVHNRRKGGGGVMLGAAMLGLRDVLYGKPKEETAIEIEASGDPPNVDLDGMDLALDETHRAVGPPLDEIKARAVQNRRSRRRTR